MEASVFDLTGRVAVVTGGNGGIGLGMARGLARAGVRVVIAARDEAKSKDAVKELEALGPGARAVATDVTDEAAVRRMVKATLDAFGRLDVLVNIQVNAVLPGWIDTALTRRARQEIPGLHERVLERTPAARWGTIDDMAGIAVFLASPASDFVTGTAIPVDGGYSIQG